MSTDPPRLVVHGRWTGAQAHGVALALVLVAIASLFASFGAAREGMTPWGVDARLLVPLLLTGELVAAIGGVFVLRALWARVGSAALHEDRIVVEKDGTSTLLPLSELAGFRDDSPGFVALLRQGDRSRWLVVDVWTATIPTPDEKERTEVLAFLAEKNVARLP